MIRKIKDHNFMIKQNRTKSTPWRFSYHEVKWWIYRWTIWWSKLIFFCRPVICLSILGRPLSRTIIIFERLVFLVTSINNYTYGQANTKEPFAYRKTCSSTFQPIEYPSIKIIVILIHIIFNPLSLPLPLPCFVSQLDKHKLSPRDPFLMFTFLYYPTQP